MENIGGSIYQVVEASDFNFENVQFLMSDDIYGQQVVQMQPPNQAELVVNDAQGQQQQQQQMQQVVYQTQDQNQTYILQQQPQEQHISQPVVFQTAPVAEERVSEQPVYYTELQTPREQAQAALNQQQQQVITQQNHIPQQQVILNTPPEQNNQLQFVTHTPNNRPVLQHHTSPPQMTIIQQPNQNQQQQYYVAAPQQQYYIQQSPQSLSRIVFEPQMHSVPTQRTIVLQQPARMVQPQIRHIVQQQQPIQHANIVRMSHAAPQQQQQQQGNPQITLTPRPRPPQLQTQPRPRISRPRIQRPNMTVTARPRVPNVAQNIQQPSPQNVKVNYITAPMRQNSPTQRVVIQRTLTPNRVLLTRPASQRVVLQTTPRFQSPPPQHHQQQQQLNQQQQVVTIKKTVQKPTTDDPDDIESSITAAIVSRKPDGTPADQPDELQGYQMKRPTQQQPTQQQMRTQIVKKVTGAQTPIIPAQNLKQEEETKERESAKMLVILQSGEQRLITFTLPKECCTVQELLEQVGVPFSADSNIQCISNPGADIDYVVTVGVTVDSNELMVVAENTMKQPQVQAAQAQAQLQMQQHQQQQQQQQQQQVHPQVQITPQLQTVPTPKLQTVPTMTTTTNAAVPDPNEPKPKIVKGYLAVCNYCGATSMDHARCQRCRRIFKGEVKVIPIPAVKQPKQMDNESNKKIQIVKREMPNASLERGEIASTRGRGTGRGARNTRKVVKPEEPVILTLSSDEEGDGNGQSQSSNSQQIMTKTMKNISNLEPFKFEPSVTETNHGTIVVPIRDDITDGEHCFFFKCRVIRIGQQKFDSEEKVAMSTKGLKVTVPPMKNKNEGSAIINISQEEIVKILFNISKNLNVLFVYVVPSCAGYIRDSLEMSATDYPAYDSCSRDSTRTKIILELECSAENVLTRMKKAFEFSKEKLEEIKVADAELMIKRCDEISSNASAVASTANGNEILVYPPHDLEASTGRLSIYKEDYLCLAVDQYLNDVIIEFYLKYLTLEVLSEEQRARTHVFSTFFYKRLTTIEKRSAKVIDKDPKLTPAQKRHLRVIKWTKRVDIFKKDFIVIPINEQSHWFLAIICFPSLTGPCTMDGNRAVKNSVAKRTKKVKGNVAGGGGGTATVGNKMLVQIGNTTITPVKKEDTINVPGDESERDEAEGDDSELNTDDEDAPEEDAVDAEFQPIKQPCILIFDSLAGTPRSRVVATLRDYLTCEWKAKHPNGPPRIFNKDNLPGHNVKVPQQNNFTDCGLYLLQYVEHFFREPIQDYRIPIKNIQGWFEAIEATKKREDISILLKKLIAKHKPSALPLPEIEFPTLGGKLIEADETEFEDGAETDGFEDPDMGQDESTKQPQMQQVVTRQITKFTKRPNEEKSIYKTKAPRLDPA